jgi:hypothetical protein
VANSATTAVARAEMLASQLQTFCESAAGALLSTVDARRDQRAAWDELTDRGWPEQAPVEPRQVELAMEWLRIWREMLALPVRVRWPRDLLRRRSIRRRLGALEQELRPVMPAALWTVVEPLNDVGRATLSHALQGLLVWAEAHGRVQEAMRGREAIATRVAILTHRALTLGITPPSAPLDLDGWKDVATAARLLAANAIDPMAPADE